MSEADIDAELAEVDDRVSIFPEPPLRRRWSAADIIRLLVGLVFVAVGLLAASFAERTIAGAEDDLVDAIGRIPNSIEQVVLGSAQLIATFVPLLALGVVIWRRRWRLLFNLWLAGTVASLVTTLLIVWLGDRNVATVIAQRTVEGTPLVAADFPTTGYLASAAATVTVGAAYLQRRWKRAAWSWVFILVLLRLLGPGQPPLDVWIGLSLGVVVGSIALLLFGSPNPEPGPTEILEALRDVGLDPAEVRRREEVGHHATYDTVERDGRRTFIKLRTPDDRSWDLLSRLYRAVRLRSSEVSRPYSTLKRRVEHEALAVLTVRDAGARSPAVLGVGTTRSGAAFVVEELVDGRRLSTLADEEFDDEMVRAVFTTVRSVHATRIAHHDLTLDNLLLDGSGLVWLVDYDEAELAASHRDRARDIAELLVALALVIGPERSVALGVERLGNDAVAASLPLLQPLALSRSLGKSIRSQRSLLDQLRHHIHESTGADDVELEQLARYSRERS